MSTNGFPAVTSYNVSGPSFAIQCAMLSIIFGVITLWPPGGSA